MDFDSKFISINDNVLSASTKRLKAFHKITGVYGVFRQRKRFWKNPQ